MLAGCADAGDLVGDPLTTIKSGGTLQFTGSDEANLIVIWTVIDQLNMSPTFIMYFDTIIEDMNAVSPDTLSVPTPMALPIVAAIAIAPGISHVGYNPFPLKLANITTRLGDLSVPSDVFTSDLALVYPQYHTTDMFRREGGYHTSRKLTSEVDALFLPGIIVGSDSSEAVRYQHRKMFVKHLGNSLHRPYFVKVYGFNNRKNNVIKWALEKDSKGLPKINGSEIIKDYLTPPSLYGTYLFTELQSDHSILVGNNGVLSEGKGQGVWLRQACLKNMSDASSDLFTFGILYSEL